MKPWTGEFTDRAGLLLPVPPSLKYVARERVVRDPITGRPIRIWTDDSGTVTQIETDDTLAANVRPATIRAGQHRQQRRLPPPDERHGRPSRRGY